MKASASVALRVSAPVVGATLVGNRWTPEKDAAGFILKREWAGLPPRTCVEWMGTAFESQQKMPFGAEADYRPWGTNPTGAHYNAFTGMGLDPETGDCYHFGGGHNDGSNNMLSKFAVARGEHSIVIPPSHQRCYPPGYSTSGDGTSVYYPDRTARTRLKHFFDPTETTPGDGKPSASHTYQGGVFVPGINEFVLARMGWMHAMPDSKAWRVGPQVAPENRLGYSWRGGAFIWAHHLPKTGLVYMRMNTEVHPQSASTVIKYDPAARKEVGTLDTVGISGIISGCVDADGVAWFFNGYSNVGGSCSVSALNLITGAKMADRIPNGRRPTFHPVGADGGNPCDYIPKLDKILMLVTWGHENPAFAGWGDMLEYDRATNTFIPFPIAGALPPFYAADGTTQQWKGISNKFRWLPQGVLLIHPQTNLNAWVIKL